MILNFEVVVVDTYTLVFSGAWGTMFKDFIIFPSKHWPMWYWNKGISCTHPPQGPPIKAFVAVSQLHIRQSRSFADRERPFGYLSDRSSDTHQAVESWKQMEVSESFFVLL